MAEKKGLTGKAVGAAVTDGVEGGNGFKVKEGAPSSASELHTSAMDIRQCITADGKHGEETSPMAVDVTHMIYAGRRRSGPMMPIHRAKEVLLTEDQLCKRNRPMAEPNGETGGSFP
jgi:hypothetical protein